MARSSLLACAAVVIAGCGRIGFDPTGVELCAPPVAVEAGAPVEVALCAGSADFAFDVAEGSRVSITLALPAAQLTSADLRVLGPDELVLGRPTWTSAAIVSDTTVTITGQQRVRIESDLAQAAMLTLSVTPPPGRVFHIAPDGLDTNDGSASAPWQTWPAVLPRLLAGDTLIVDDGTWTARASCADGTAPCLASTVMPSVNCEVEGANGTATQPITIIAKHQRQAHLIGDGQTETMLVQRCAWWIVDGLHGESSDFGTSPNPGAVFMFLNTPDLIARNLLANNPNRCGNNHAIEIGGYLATNALLEDSEVYNFYRAAIIAVDSDNMRLRRNYVHSRSTPSTACSFPDGYADRGDEGVFCYNFVRAQSCVVDNGFVENVGAAFYDDSSVTSRVTGSIAVDSYFGAIYTFKSAPASTTPRTLTDLACLNCDVGIWNLGLVVDARGATLVGGRARTGPGYGARADAGAGSTTARTEFRNVLALDNETGGFLIGGQTSWLIGYSTVAGSPLPYEPSENIGDDVGNIIRSLTTVPTEVGDVDGSCLVYVPATSNMRTSGEAGAPLGATIVHQTHDGVVTDRKLWNQRTGQFPCGALVKGVNDLPGVSCFDAHERVRVGVGGCAIP